MFHKVSNVEPLDDMKLMVSFISGDKKRYDVKPLLDKWKPFQSLTLPGLFECVKVDTGGYGIVWNDELDLSCDELWHNGETVSSHDMDWS